MIDDLDPPHHDDPDAPVSPGERAGGDAGGPPGRDPDDLDGYETSMTRLVSRGMRWVAALVALLLLVPAGGWIVDELRFRSSGRAVEEAAGGALADSVFLVRSLGCAGSAGSGSAFVLDVGDGPVVVTNRHVVEGAASVGLRTLDGRDAVRVTGVRLAPTVDVAVLTVDDPDALPPALRIGPTVGVGDTVRIVGFPAAVPYTTSGTVVDDQQGPLLLDARVDPGASGSPVVDGQDRVVAQVFARTDEGLGVATPAAAVRAGVRAAEEPPPC
ncbi:MAG: serine protease [Actinomycetes bacterium]